MDLTRYDWSHRVTEALQRILIRRPDRIVVNSRAGGEFAACQGFPVGLQSIIPNGIDTKKFARDAAAGRSIRESWGIPPDSRLIGIIARFDPMKDHQTFLKAASLASESDKDFRFVCVGDGPQGTGQSCGTLRLDWGWRTASPGLASVVTCPLYIARWTSRR